jgi:hypothetical protein
MTTSRQQTLENGEEQLMSSQGDFHASPSVPLEKDWEKKMTAIFGPICSKQSKTLDQDMSWGRMFVDSLVGRTDWFSKRSTLIWKVRDTKSKRLYFQLSASTLHTKETGSGLLLKTPAAMDGYSENLSKKEQKFGNSGTLAQEVASGFIYKRGLLPTPTTQEIETPCELTETGRRKCHNGDSHSLNIGRVASMGLLPTPNSYDWNTAAKPETYLARSQRHKDKNVNLQMSLRQMTMFIPNKVDHPKLGTASQLNPHFVAEMMGFPFNWTDLPFLSGEKKV